MKKENRKDVNHKVILNERPAGFQNLPRKVVSQRQQQRQTWKIPYQVRDDRPLLNNGDGFTLIELLVVVLIIGILAAVALPQYKWAVEKAHAAEAWTVLRALKEAQEARYMATGEYATDIADLDIDVGESKIYDFGISQGSVWATEKNIKYSLGIRLSFGAWQAGEYRYCGYPASTGSETVAKPYCKHLGADITQQISNTWVIP